MKPRVFSQAWRDLRTGETGRRWVVEFEDSCGCVEERWRDERSDLPLPLTNVQGHLAVVQELAAEEAATLPRQIGDGS